MSDLARCCGKRDWNNALEKVRESIEDTKAAMQQTFTVQKGKPGVPRSGPGVFVETDDHI